jgi:hypothetical protein
MNSAPATSIVTQRMSLAICAEIFGKRRTEEDVEFLKGLEGGDEHIDIKE